MLIDSPSNHVYADNFAVADNGDIHVSFIFRYSSPICGHNYSYAWSNDSGTTWRKSDGTAYSLPITEASAEKFDFGEVTGLTNSNHIDVRW